jgi:hypothetical protein
MVVFHLWSCTHDISLSSGFLQVENPLTVTGLLQSLGLGKYNIIFRAEEVSWQPLSNLSI